MNLIQRTTLLIIPFSILAGCGSGSAPITADADSVNRSMTMRNLYNKSNGNYDRLSADEKSQFAKSIAPGMPVEKAWNSLAPQKASMGGSRDPREQGG